jgi:hypothetical protein
VTFRADEVAIAVPVAILAQLGLVWMLASPGPRDVRADISDEAAKPIAVAITPLVDQPLLKLGQQQPAVAPGWQRKTAPKQDENPLPSPQAQIDAGPVDKPVSDAGPPVEPTDAGTGPASPNTPEDASVVSDSGLSGPGDPSGSDAGTETDPLKGRAVAMYRSQLDGFFSSRFNIRGKIPFELLEKLSATVVIQVSPDRKVTGFSVVKPSGDPIFDQEVRAAVAGVQSSGIELPAPPPRYPELLGPSVTLGFRCTVRKACE